MSLQTQTLQSASNISWGVSVVDLPPIVEPYSTYLVLREHTDHVTYRRCISTLKDLPIR